VPPRLFKKKRRAAVSLAAVAAVLLAGGLTMAFSGGGGIPAGESYVDGSPLAVMYARGHRPMLPDFSGKTLTGTPLSVTAYRGKVVVLNFWGGWCPECQSEGQTLAALSAKYSSPAVSFLGVDVEDTVANARAYERTYGITYPSMNDPGQAVAQVVSAAIPINATPETLVIDSTGHIAGVIYGTAAYSVLNTMISKVAA
jgi:peroxiredoxin